MKKESELKPFERQEKAWTQKRIHYHNVQAKGVTEWKEQAQNVLKKKMEDARLSQIFAPLHLKEDPATEFLFENPVLNKIHSMYCDLYEELPYRPDMAFDVVWRSFEILSKYYSREVLGNKNIGDVVMFNKISLEAISNLLKSDNKLDAEFKELMSSIPDTTLRFMVVRLYVKRELGVLPQLGPIKDRAKKLLSEELYDAFYGTYFDAEGNLPIADHRRAVSKMRSILNGEFFELNGEHFKPLDLEVRIELIISCLLYVSRCERYHGDYFSQLKSSMAKQVTYHNFYYLVTMTDLLFWMVWYQFAAHRGLSQIFSLEQLADCSKQRRANLTTIFG
jgi:hypothetical protein